MSRHQPHFALETAIRQASELRRAKRSALRERIAKTANQNPELTFTELGRRFGVSSSYVGDAVRAAQ